MTKRALFIVPASSDATQVAYAYLNNVWDAACYTFDIGSSPVDEAILVAARAASPDVIFYMGGESGPGLPSVTTLCALREIAPSVHLGGDFADPPWLPRLEEYRREGCFSLTVSIDGVPGDHVDYATLTPVDISAFDVPDVERDIWCAFAGNHVDRARHDHILKEHGTFDVRSKLLHEIGDRLTLRQRDVTGNYADYVSFLKRCSIMFNTAWTGSGTATHCKGRILEAAFAGCALLEMKSSPTTNWFPQDAFFRFSDADDALTAIEKLSPTEAAERAALLSYHARKHYHPKVIYGNILERF